MAGPGPDACSLPVSTASSRDYVPSPKRKQALRRLEQRKRWSASCAVSALRRARASASDVLVGERKQDTAASAIERRLGWPLSLYA